MIEWFQEIFLYNPEKPMLFSSLFFWGFFAITLFGYSFIYKKHWLRNTYLFILSLFFYYKSGGYFFSLLVFTTIVDYSVGFALGKSKTKFTRKFLIIISVAANLLVLAYFKYSYFFVDITNNLLGTNFKVVNLLADWTNSLTGLYFDIDSIILPVGISFYTFQSMSYTIDVYRKKLAPVKSIIDFGFFVTFFPQLVAGPIVRASEFIPQLYLDYKLTKREFGYALFLILNGLIKKMVISDYISMNFVDRVFDNPMAYSGFENLTGVYGYGLQIYCDFSGYTDIAIGVALLLGFRLPINFNSPYKASNITDFWRRWHISLSTWLRDYLYITLGGNRKGKFRTYFNLMLTMVLGGLWHGANIRFIIWGTIHGVALALHKIWLSVFSSHKKQSAILRMLGVFVTFNLVCFAWLFFRAHSLNDVSIMLNQIAFSFQFSLIPVVVRSYWLIFTILFAGFFIHWLPSNFKEKYRGWFIETPVWLKVIITVIVVIIIFQAKSSNVQPFIYFQF
ncbi:MAG: MBOAT family protein [Bacteroidetes bacterium CG02_land_8_20_14_3_00_31_25]|nr:MBOAT family protein [Bacteroidota bacterium]PIV58376.1 MAG: MBOAT family protein [Bacteroidetes bacterium CG02_land_8_20_14_3_00_31_25]PIX32619.1 MAG: MBOAT family protein [Bacteroidetes bacterium CG_4_8_14_3_um_filter_31_14]PIY04150.1 MAG: MBOAT family protein [Bacteroidetes bacterium CG_4_10_14_3_um_filter_31_20]